ncbi:MAG: YhjD/YihY/BrkB family envelope integrity protein [Nocardioidaceae bacterium]
MHPDPQRDRLAELGLPAPLLTALDRLPAGVRQTALRQLDHWPGRVVLGTAGGLRRIEVFDRAMTIAAQLFTSVFPIIIMGAALFGSGRTTDAIASVGGLPQDAQDLLDEVDAATGSATFGVIGVLVVLISATSLSRALTRAYDAIWQLGRTPSRLVDAWRWVAAVVALSLVAVLTHVVVTAVRPIPPHGWWAAVVTLVIDTAVAALIPWLILAGRVGPRALLPGAVLFGVGMVLAHPVSTRVLSASVEISAGRFGAIGVAFAYLTYLYVVSWWLLATAVVGQVLVSDGGVPRLLTGAARERTR